MPSELLTLSPALVTSTSIFTMLTPSGMHIYTRFFLRSSWLMGSAFFRLQDITWPNGVGTLPLNNLGDLVVWNNNHNSTASTSFPARTSSLLTPLTEHRLEHLEVLIRGKVDKILLLLLLQLVCLLFWSDSFVGEMFSDRFLARRWGS